MGKHIDSVSLVGQEIGLWTVIEVAPNRNKKTLLKCRCKCGLEKVVGKIPLLHGKSRGCIKCINGTRNKSLTGSLSPSWKGGKTKDDSGYILLYRPNHHRSKSNGYVREHILVMENFLGRSLTKNETVHHRNGIRSDNHIDNLELWSTSQPFGQRVSDKVAWAIEILKQYKPEELINNGKTTGDCDVRTPEIGQVYDRNRLIQAARGPNRATGRNSSSPTRSEVPDSSGTVSEVHLNLDGTVSDPIRSWGPDRR